MVLPKPIVKFATSRATNKISKGATLISQNNSTIFNHFKKFMTRQFEYIGEVSKSRTFHQLGIFILDGSNSMKAIGDNNRSLNQNINHAIRNFLTYFKGGSIVKLAICISIISFYFPAYAQVSRFDSPAEYKPMPDQYYERQSRSQQYNEDVQMIIRANEAREKRIKARYEMERAKCETCQKNLKELYLTFIKFPDVIPDGLHNVTVTNNGDFCDERMVTVQGNKIIRYYIDSQERIVTFSTIIKSGKGYIRLEALDGDIPELLEIYFIESILTQ